MERPTAGVSLEQAAIQWALDNDVLYKGDGTEEPCEVKLRDHSEAKFSSQNPSVGNNTSRGPGNTRLYRRPKATLARSLLSP